MYDILRNPGPQKDTLTKLDLLKTKIIRIHSMKAQSFAIGMREEVLCLEQRPVLFYFHQRQATRTARARLRALTPFKRAAETFCTYYRVFEPAFRTDDIELCNIFGEWIKKR